jgi:nucleotide-binding universal stress UspA family protein
MKLLLPLDVTGPYQETLRQLERLVPLEGSDIFLLYVAHNMSGLESVLTSIGKPAQHIDQELKQRAQTILDEVADQLKKVCRTVIVQILQGPPAVTIEDLAVSQDFDLIALGATHPSTNPFNVLGKTAAHVVKHAPGTIVILREGPKEQEAPVKVLVAVDGSAASMNAITAVASQFAALKRKFSVSVVTVVSIVGIWKFIAPVEFIASIEDNLNMAAETILADADKVLAESGITPVDMIIRTGDPANEIIKAAKDIKADLIVVGAQGRSSVEEFFLGSVSHKLSMQASCSTVIVK